MFPSCDLNEECLQLLAKALRDRELKSKFAKQHNRKCEGQEDCASSLYLHRQQSAAALLTPENWSSSSSDAKTFKPRPLYRTEKSKGLLTLLTQSLFLPALRNAFHSLFGDLRPLIVLFLLRDTFIISSFGFLHFHVTKNVRSRTSHDLYLEFSPNFVKL